MDATPGHHGAAVGARPGSRHEAAPARVLVVDDDAACRALSTATLTRAGHDVIEAADGLEGLELARTELPDMALLDVAMPGLDGFQVAEALRGWSRTQAMPIVFTTGDTRPESRTRADTLGAFGYLAKPYRPEALASLVASWPVRRDERPTAP